MCTSRSKQARFELIFYLIISLRLALRGNCMFLVYVDDGISVFLDRMSIDTIIK